MKKIWMLTKDPDALRKWYEISSLAKSFKQAGIESQVYQPDNFDIITNRKIHNSIRYNGNILDLPDAVLVRTGTDTNYRALCLLRQLESFGVPVLNSSDSITKSRDKLLSGQILAQANIPTPRTMLVNFPINVEIIEEEIGFPCVIKIVIGTHGKGVYLCQNRQSFVKIMELIESIGSSKDLIVQEFISSGELFDLRVWVIGGNSLIAMKRTAPPGDFRTNITVGGIGTPYPLNDEIRELSKKTAEVLGLDITGIDLLYDGTKFLVCEANSSPNFKGIDQSCQTDMSTTIVNYVKNKL